MTPTGWEGILDKGERILWQGRPDTGLHLSAPMLLQAGFGVIFAGFALFWMVAAGTAGGLFWLAGLPHFLIGVGVIAAAIAWPAFRRSRSWYTLTDRRAFIATDLPLKGRALHSWPIGPETAITFLPGRLSTIHFASRTKRGQNGTRIVPVGFEFIPDGPQVLELMRRIQTGRITAADAARDAADDTAGDATL